MQIHVKSEKQPKIHVCFTGLKVCIVCRNISDSGFEAFDDEIGFYVKGVMLVWLPTSQIPFYSLESGCPQKSGVHWVGGKSWKRDLY